MIYFICWVVFLVALILSVAVTHFMDTRGDRAARSGAVADEPSFTEDAELAEGEESFDDLQAAESLEDFPADDFPDAGFPSDSEQPADDFAAFEEEFK